VSSSLERLRSALADRYRIERQLGQGGMATVYLAQDIKHHRHVAIKVLHPELSALLGSERFLKEIELTANLQHPHVLPLFDSGEADGLLYYVMPFVDGETLRSRLEREQLLPVAEAVRITIEVADALQYAHKHGVVHRDIKPENILLHDGRPLVADFGIALAVQQAGGSRMTQTGISLGTPQYMAPEQAMGARHVDHRTDIYALGVVAYEMLAGEPPFIGPSSQAIVARVMTEKPRSLRSLRDTVPAHVAEAVHTAMQKLPADRFDSAAEFARSLQDPGFHATGAIRAIEGTGQPARKLTPAMMALGGIAIGLAALAAWGWFRPEPAGLPKVSWRLPVPIPESEPITTSGQLSLSHDGALLVFGAGVPGHLQLWLRRADAPTPQPIEGTEGGYKPALSPDGRRVAFRRANRLWVVPIEGGNATMVTDSFLINSQPAWIDDQNLVFANITGLERVSVGGENRESVTRIAAGEGWHLRPNVLPGGRGIVFTVAAPAGEERLEAHRIAVTGPGAGHSILMPGIEARYAHPGHLLVLRADGTLVAVPFDASARRASGSARTVATGLTVTNFAGSGFAVSPTGRLAFLSGSAFTVSDLVRVRRDGQATTMDSSWAANIVAVAASPAGRRIAVALLTGTAEEIQVRDLVTGGATRVAIPGTQVRGPSFSGDGKSLLFVSLASTQLAIYRIFPGTSGVPALLLKVNEQPAGPKLSPDGSTLYYSTMSGREGHHFAQPLAGGAAPVKLFTTSGRMGEIEPSPDGRWLAYLAEESGQDQLFVRSADPARTDRWQVSRSRVTRMTPRWSRDGRELFYMARDSLIAVRIAPGEDFAIASQRTLFSMVGYRPSFDVLSDAEFIMVRPRPLKPGSQQLIMMENWNVEGDQ
jgi:serine/threonine-protein kinase